MAELRAGQKIQFVVETLEVKNGKKLQNIKPDANGYFRDFPIAVLGIPSRNGALYETESFVDQMTNPTSTINIMLTDGCLFGEWGHPKLNVPNPDKAYMRRLTEIREERQSHHFRKIGTGEIFANGGTVIRADIKPTGPYREQLLDQMLDPNINSSFSLRSICSERVDRQRQLLLRTVKHLVTFDAVGAGGYAEASKRYVPCNESMQLYMSDFVTYNENNEASYSVESITDKTILDIFNAKDMVIHRESIGIIVPDSPSFLDTKGNMRSIFHQLNNSRK